MGNVPPNKLDLSHRRPLAEKLSTSLQKRRLWLRNLRGAGPRTIQCRYLDTQFIVDLDDVIGYEIAIRRFEWRELKLMIDACRRLRPAVFLDVGANIGLYSCVLAGHKLVRSVIAFEPDRENFARLQTNMALNALADVIDARHAAVGDASGVVRLVPSGMANRGMSRIEPGASDGYEVASVALDAVVPMRDAMIALKVDVEGYEAQVLAGAAELLSHNGGFAQIEAREDVAAALVADRMASFGWRFLERYGLDLRFEKP